MKEAIESDSPEQRMPKLGEIVLYKLTSGNVDYINDKRSSNPTMPVNAVHVGREYPMLVVSVNEGNTTNVNGKVFLDGMDTFWATSVYSKDVFTDGRTEGVYTFIS